jgi:hypothetical protein
MKPLIAIVLAVIILYTAQNFMALDRWVNENFDAEMMPYTERIK